MSHPTPDGSQVLLVRLHASPTVALPGMLSEALTSRIHASWAVREKMFWQVDATQKRKLEGLKKGSQEVVHCGADGRERVQDEPSARPVR